MDSHTHSTVNRLEVVETGRRRRWTEEEKARIVLESMAGPRLVSATARRHGLSRSLLVTWRRALGFDRRHSETGFVRAMIGPEIAAAPVGSSQFESSYASERRIEIVLGSGRRIFVGSDVDVEALGRIVAVLDRQGPFYMACAGERRCVDLAGANELFAVRDRLAQSPGVLAADERGLKVCR